MAGRGTLRLTFIGHVDHGKSTAIGRLLHETGALPTGKVEEIRTASERRGVPFEWSFVLDALQAERDQAITIDTTRVWFERDGRRFEIIDAPGHREFVRNMLSGASEADAAVLIVDAAEGVSEQTRRHAQLVGMLGIRQVVIAVNKMDAIGWDRARFDAVAAEARAALASAGVEPAAIVPMSARDGDNIVAGSGNAPWYSGPTLLAAIEAFVPPRSSVEEPLRLRVQDVYRMDETRIAVGRVDAGTVRKGDRVVILPGGAHATVRSIEVWNEPDRTHAIAGESMGLSFEEPVYVDRGDLIVPLDGAPAVDHAFSATCFWLSDEPPVEGEHLTVEFGPTSARVTLVTLRGAVDSSSLAATATVPQYALADMELRSRALLPLDEHANSPALSRFVLMRGDEVVAGGFVTATTARARHDNLHPAEHIVGTAARETRNGHRGAVIWLTGLSGSGKSTLAMELERRLFARGAQVAVLDGDTVRTGLNSDLGFSPRDRAENIRRVAEVAAIFADLGSIVITAFISPMREDRARARSCAAERFHEIYIDADLATCEERDPKGLYAKARAGEIESFTGISAPYEAPTAPEFAVRTGGESVAASAERLLDYVLKATGL